MRTKRIIAGIAAMTMALSMSLTAFATIPELRDPQPETLEVTTERSAHTYTYWQMFTGTWYEDDNGKVWLSDAEFGDNINAEDLVSFMKEHYEDDIKVYLTFKAKTHKIIPESGKYADIETAIKADAERKQAGSGTAAWTDSEYNLVNWGTAEDVLTLFRRIIEKNTDEVNDNPFVAGTDDNVYGDKFEGTTIAGSQKYGSSDDHSKQLTKGESTVAEILERFTKGAGIEVNADYNEEVSVTVDNGYYLISEKDEGWKTDGRQSSVNARYATLLKIVDRELTITPKIGTPVFEKKIGENVKNVRSVGNGLVGAYKDLTTGTAKWNDAGDYSIGDSVPFALFGTMPENINDYEHYFYQFKDRLAKGFVKPAVSDIKVFIGKTDPVQNPDDGDNVAASRNLKNGIDVTEFATITVTDNTDGSSAITVTFDDLKAIDNVDVDIDTVVRVTYSATLDKDANVGKNGNTNGGSLVYSTDLHYDGSGLKENVTSKGDENKEGETNDDKKTSVSETTEDGVTAFTYQIQVNKMDGETEDALAGAMFTLQAKNGVHAGKYVKVNSDNVVIGWSDTATEENYMTTDDEGHINVVGIDDGAYELVEVKAPNGYNSLHEAVPVTIISALNDDGTYFYIKDNGSAAYLGMTKSEDLEEKMARVVSDDGMYLVDIANNKGIELPQTGGAGTMILYIASGALILAGGAYFVLRKPKAEKE